MLKKLLPALFAIVLFPIRFTPVSAAPQTAPSPYEVIAAVNALRASYGLPSYLIDPILMIAAQGQADYLASTPNFGSGHVGPGGTDADVRAHALGYPEVPGLDINENWCAISEGDSLDTLIYQCWGDDAHMHTMLHERGQQAGCGVSVSGDRIYVILDVAAFWGDAGLTAQPTSSAYGGTAAGDYVVSQYIAPVIKATSAPDGSIMHNVMSGQSLWMIAQHYGVDIEQLKQLNNLGSTDMIYIGQKILIQPTSSATATITALPTIQPTVQQDSIFNSTDTPVNTVQKSSTSTPSPYPSSRGRDESGWFLVFFGLFGAGVVLIVLSLSIKR